MRRWARRLLAAIFVVPTAAFLLASSFSSSFSNWFVAPSFNSPLPASNHSTSWQLSHPSSSSLAHEPKPESFVYPAIMASPAPSPSPVPKAAAGNSDGAETGYQCDGSNDLLNLKPQASVVLTKVDEELIYAKKEIERAPIAFNDPELYAPLFHNVSVFKRSYELMEKILKVYIYDDGPRPIFHTPQLKGIYASEGWFLMLMEENKRFVVKDPSHAHLFYLPYSSRQLEEALYKPNSHDMKPLLIFLKNYVDMISSKYSFWNRTRGSDHFIVACHDWGPYTTKLHDEFRKNTIKALCNADVSEGVFIRGKDVSLPETNIRIPKKPIRDIGGRRVSQRPILAFFAGNMHGRIRPILLDYWNGKEDDMKIYGPLPSSISVKMSYAQHMKSSKYCICPMGYEVNSPRIVEAIYYECVPVIIADNFVLPFEEVLDWSAFSIVIAEKDIPKLKDILTRISLRRYVYLQTNVKKLQKHFLWHQRPVKYDIFHMILHSIWFNRLNHMQIYDSNNLCRGQFDKVKESCSLILMIMKAQLIRKSLCGFATIKSTVLSGCK
ncbi:LOW QUALITY PROTEIN: probable glycosyltransferase At5g03795 [Phalaenopsis equestris]|uniref:LOW QUALITY PROTEIN: probable glycosyltransferase At5g03795 n=1 Tax=Phalaenopsis equestris TaxID=78828 RepID=UPI0009E3CEC7|nr:LOW QUALITY PROTEIN: probable glycosyltransferase At5g03795 [Phalaenopsis equestris]